MGDTSVGYRHDDYPVMVSTTFIPRAQSINLDHDEGIITHWELGNAEPAGVSDGPDTNRGSITWFPIDITMEKAFSGVTPTTTQLGVYLSDYITATGVNVYTPTKGVTGAKVSSLEYSCDAGGEHRATVNFEGLAWASTGTTITASAPTGVGAFRSPLVHVEMYATQATRAQSFRARANLRQNTLFELGNDSPAGVVADRPEVTLEVTWYESTAMSGNQEFTVGTPRDCEVQVGGAWDTAANIKYIFKNMVSAGESERGSVDGWVTVTHRYQSAGDTTYAGMTANTIGT